MHKSFQILKNHREAIKRDFDSGMSVMDLTKQDYIVKSGGCAYNTMIVVTGLLGYKVSDCYKHLVENAKKYAKRRVQVNEEVKV